VSLPIQTPFLPMEALSTGDIPDGPEWQYEPKWDGFRCLAFRDGAAVEMQSKAGQPLARYFPEMVEALAAVGAKRFVLDGEIVIPAGKQLAFDELLMRIHPAESRIKKLAREHPGLYLVFDLLVDEKGKSLVDRPLSERRERLEEFAGSYLDGAQRIRLSPFTTEMSTARKWFRTMGGSLDGVIAKNRNAPYEPGERTGGFRKIKNLRTADCVVGGFRYASAGKVVGSLLLGLYDEGGLLNHVGFTSSIAKNEKAELTAKLEKLIEAPGFTGAAPGGPSRWSTERSTEWQPLAPKLVAEVQYDHFSGGRFRHGTKLIRFRPDKAPGQCTMAQVQQESKSPLALL
jgi:ATP-dependent DNA ligase